MLAKRQALDDAKNSKSWTLEEMSLLAKAVAKFPGGTAKRWEKVTEMINTAGNRTVKEVIVKCKEFDQEQQRLGKDQAFSRYQEIMSSKIAASEESKIRNLNLVDKVEPKFVPKVVPKTSANEDEEEEEPATLPMQKAAQSKEKKESLTKKKTIYVKSG